ncbi:MAG: LysR family transcriptional regulator [bacterium]|nr:LysR family transcriptional regulator [bacterium]
MELERYEALLCVIESGSLSAAAEKLGYTPSGISRMMATLEEENGFPLLYRLHKGVYPTRECERLLPAIRELIFYGENVKQVSAQICGLDVGSVTIGTAYNCYYPWISKVISRFHQVYPEIQVEIQNGNSTELLGKMKEHQLDLCIISKREGDYDWIPLVEDDLIALVSKEHALASENSVPIKCFATEAYIDTYPEMDTDNARVLAKNKISPNVKFKSLDISATYMMVEAGLGIGMNNGINRQTWNKNVVELPLDPPETISIGIAVTNIKSPAAKTFFSFIKDFVPEIQTMQRV